MSHLPIERLAALVDESPTAEELAHLTSCAECARDRAALGSLGDLAAAESARIGAPLTTWESLRPALVADGVIDNGRAFQPRARQVPAARRPWLQAAAAVLLVSGGVIAGRYSAGAAPLPNAAATVASADSAPAFKSVEDAVAAQSRSQMMYQTATAYLAQHDTANAATETPAGIRTRLAALDRVGQAMSEARNESPYDPVINGYYLTAMGQREAALQQLNTVMPASMKITSY